MLVRLWTITCLLLVNINNISIVYSNLYSNFKKGIRLCDQRSMSGPSVAMVTSPDTRVPRRFHCRCTCPVWISRHLRMAPSTEFNRNMLYGVWKTNEIVHTIIHYNLNEMKSNIEQKISSILIHLYWQYFQ